MSNAQRYALGSLVTTGLIYFFFQERMLDGWQVVDRPVNALFWTYGTVVVLAIIAESVLAGFVFARSKGGVDMDERDHAIDARAEANAGLFVVAALNIIIFYALAAGAFPDHTIIGFWEAFALDSPASILFALFSVLFAGHWVKLVSALYLYSRSG